MTTEQVSLNCEGPYICGFFSINTMVLWDPWWWICRCRTAYPEDMLWELRILGLWNSSGPWNQCWRTHSDHCIFNLCCVFLVTQSCLTLCYPMDCSPPGSSVHGVLQARILEWAAMPSPGKLPNPGIKPRFETNLKFRGL